MTNGILLALIAYASYSCSDAVIKSLGAEFTVFEIAFFVTLFAGGFLFFSRPADERWRGFWRPPTASRRRIVRRSSGRLSSALFFREYPDFLSLTGLAVVGGSGLLTMVREEVRLGTCAGIRLRGPGFDLSPVARP
ncbi:hypothetical protein [Mesorhizobium sp. 128a]